VRIFGLNPTEFWMLFVVGVSSLALETLALLFPEWTPVISRVMRADGGRWVLWPALLGGLGGHFWSPRWLYFPALKPLGYQRNISLPLNPV
jgi:hypothetical protein